MLLTAWRWHELARTIDEGKGASVCQIESRVGRDHALKHQADTSGKAESRWIGKFGLMGATAFSDSVKRPFC